MEKKPFGNFFTRLREMFEDDSIVVEESSASEEEPVETQPTTISEAELPPATSLKEAYTRAIIGGNKSLLEKMIQNSESKQDYTMLEYLFTNNLELAKWAVSPEADANLLLDLPQKIWNLIDQTLSDAENQTPAN